MAISTHHRGDAVPTACVKVMNDGAQIGVIVHAAVGEQAEALDFLALVCSSIGHQGVAVGALAECATAAGAAACSTRLVPLRRSGHAISCLTQPTNIFSSFSSLLNLLSLRPTSIIVVSYSNDASVLALAREQGCRPARLGPTEVHTAALAVMQSVAALAAETSGTLCVGYIMKPSRQQALMQAGMLPLVPHDGVCFMPLSPSFANVEELPPCHMLLHKATDYLQWVEGSGAVPSLAPHVDAWLQLVQAAPELCVVDGLACVRRVMDRAALGRAVQGACTAARNLGVPVRSPAWVLCEQLGDGTAAAAAAAGVRLPCIVKPQAACGVPEAHQMAFVMHAEGFVQPGVPVPAVVQEYVDHGGTLHKVYVAGDKVFVTQRKSTPDLQSLVQQLATDPSCDIPSSLNFDSLQALPTNLPWLKSRSDPAGAAGAAAAGSAESSGAGAVRQDVLELLAGTLRAELGLTLFGFDVVFDYAAGEVVVVDVNYLPSFKGIPEAPHALRLALLAAWERHKMTVAANDGT